MLSIYPLGTLSRAARMAVTAMTAAAGLLIPALAAADAVHYGYVWKKDAGGRWEDRSNWNCINPAGGGCIPAENKGYPNVAGDEAYFDAGIYTARHTVVVTQTNIRVAKIVFGDGPGFDLQPMNLGQIILNSGVSSPAEIVTTDRSSGDSSTRPQLFVPFVNESPLVVNAGTLTQVFISTDIGPFGFGLTVRGGGELILARPTTYTGPTIVESGHLVLDNPDPSPTLLSPQLVVG